MDRDAAQAVDASNSASSEVPAAGATAVDKGKGKRTAEEAELEERNIREREAAAKKTALGDDDDEEDDDVAEGEGDEEEDSEDDEGDEGEEDEDEEDVSCISCWRPVDARFADDVRILQLDFVWT